MNIKFSADRIRVSGPKVDGSYSVTFDVGEYLQNQVAELVAVPQNTVVNVEVTNG